MREGNYASLPQFLLADTRNGTGVPQAKIGAGQTIEVQVTGRGGIPATGVEAVALDITSLNSSANAPLQIWPSGSPRPAATMHTAMPGETLSNIAFVKPGTGGRVSIYNAAGTTDVLLRSTGYFSTEQDGAGFKAINQARVADTRSGTGVRQGQIASGDGVTISLTGARVPTNASAAAVTLVMIGQNNGFVNAGIPNDPSGKSGAAYAAGQNAVTKVVPIKNGELQVINGGTAGIDLLVDVQGYFGAADAGGGFYPSTTGRIYDSRSSGAGGQVAAGGSRRIPVLGQGELPKRRVGAAMLSLTVTGQTAPGVLAVTADGLTANPASNLNYEVGQVRTNSLIVPTALPATGEIVVRNTGSSPVDVVVDAEGWFDPYFDPDASNSFPGGPGLRDFSTTTDAALNDRTTVSSNAVNGNLLVAVDEVGIVGRGIGLTLGRHYNSRTDAGLANAREDGRASTNTAEYGAFGPGWTMDATGDIRLVAAGPNRVFHGPSGSEVTFTPDGNGGWLTPTGMTATLRGLSGGGFELRMDREGEKWTFTSAGTLTSVVDRNGNALTYRTNASGRLEAITDTRGRDLVFTWATPAGMTSPVVTRISDVAGRQWNYTYSGGRLESATDPANQKVTYAYLSSGRLASIADSRGVLATMNYDAYGRVTTMSRPLAGSTGGPTTATTYADGRTRVVDARGYTTTYIYDYLGRVSDVYDALGNDQSTSYDANSNITSYTPTSGQATGNSVSNTYSDNGRNNLTRSQAPTGAASTATYATNSTNLWAPTSVTDAQGSSLTYSYDAVGNQASVTDSEGGQTRVERNADGQVAVAYDAKGAATRFSYNTAGELTAIDNPAPLGDEAFTYDALSRMTSAVDGKGVTTRYVYDALDRVTGITTGSDAFDRVTYFYDTAGNRVRETDIVGDDFSTYDRHNRIVTELRAVGGEQRYSYDAVGNLLELTSSTPGASTGSPLKWIHEYNDVNLPIATTDPAGNRVTFAYDRDNLRTQTVFPGGTVQATTRDATGRAVRVRATNGSSVLTDFSYSFAQAAGGDGSLIRSRTDHVGIAGPAGSRTTYSYDRKNRLTKADERTSAGAASAAWDYAYDRNGNRTSQTLAGTTGAGTTAGATTYSYNAADQLTGINGSTTGWAYDANGNETSGGPARAGVPARSSEYNRLDQVIATTSSGVRNSFTYSGGTNDQRLRASGTTFTQSALGVVGTSATNGNTSYVTRDPSGQLLSTTINGATHYYLTDNIGSVIALVNGSGAKTATYSYDPYGVTRAASGAAAAANPYRYAGAYLDAQSGLYKMGLRYYDPSIGRFTQVDPTRQESNNYAYASCNPVSRVDPSGALSVSGILGACVEGALSEVVTSVIVGLFTGGTTTVGKVLAGCVTSAGLEYLRQVGEEEIADFLDNYLGIAGAAEAAGDIYNALATAERYL